MSELVSYYHSAYPDKPLLPLLQMTCLMKNLWLHTKTSFNQNSASFSTYVQITHLMNTKNFVCLCYTWWQKYYTKKKCATKRISQFYAPNSNNSLFNISVQDSLSTWIVQVDCNVHVCCHVWHMIHTMIDTQIRSDKEGLRHHTVSYHCYNHPILFSQYAPLPFHYASIPLHFLITLLPLHLVDSSCPPYLWLILTHFPWTSFLVLLLLVRARFLYLFKIVVTACIFPNLNLLGSLWILDSSSLGRRLVSYPIHSRFSSEVLDVRSDQIRTGSVTISFFIHILFI
jgi:hypothetical protein